MSDASIVSCDNGPTPKRRTRLTKKEREAILQKQGGLCCVPGCKSTGPFEEEHSTPWVWTGEKPDQLMCIPHHAAKTKKDIAKIAKVKRIKKRRDGLKKPGKKIASRPFPKRKKRKAKKNVRSLHGARSLS